MHSAAVVLNVASVHVAELLKLPPAPPSLHVTVLVGVVGVPEVSSTCTVYVIVFPMATVDGLGLTVVVVALSEKTGVTAKAPRKVNATRNSGTQLRVELKDVAAIFIRIVGHGRWYINVP